MRSIDTDRTADRVQIELFRTATVARRASLARSLSTTVLQLSQRAIREANPTDDWQALATRFAALCYGRGLAEELKRDLADRNRERFLNLTPQDVLAAVTPVVDALERLRARHHIGGSLASSAHGVPRATADVDLMADLRPEHVDALVAELQSAYYIDREQVVEAIRERRSFNLIHLNTMVKVDVFIPEASSFDEQELSRARPLTLDSAPDARSFYVKAPEDLVLRKLIWYRAGNQVSERQWSDVIGVLKVQAGQLDQDYLARWAAELGLRDLLERALAQAADD
ncbi:MAG: hypothetical protein EXR58_06555 [Chloroflexi bacterium]|nr:hypothetical protein [Chloroflexota bacterium]